MGDQILRINLRDVVVKSTSKNTMPIPEDYVEITPSYMRIFKGCWLKYTNIDTGLSYPGGFFIDFQDNIVTLRNIKQQISELNMKEYIFYCKKELEIYKAVQELIIQTQKLEYEKRKFNEERNKFIQDKKNFFLKNQ